MVQRDPSATRPAEGAPGAAAEPAGPGELLGAYWRSIARARDFRVQAIVNEPRDQAIDRARDALLAVRGCILDFQMFSNLSLSLIVELTGSRLLSLLEALEAVGWALEVEPDRGTLARHAEALLQGTLQLTFPDGDGELRVPVPAVPG